MDSVEVTVHARTVEQAVKVGLGELGLTSVDGADVEVIQEGKRGFLGMGGRDAVVRLSPKPAKRRRRRGWAIGPRAWCQGRQRRCRQRRAERRGGWCHQFGRGVK